MKDQLEQLLRTKRINISHDKEVKLLQRIESSLGDLKKSLKGNQVYFQDVEMLGNDDSWTLVFQIRESHFIN